MIIGGFEAYQRCLQLAKARKDFPEFCIPLAVLPATISNNDPGREISFAFCQHVSYGENAGNFHS